MPPLNNFQRSCVALAIGQALTLHGASAATINVDGMDAGAGDCTLRDAITSANDNTVTGNCDAGDAGPLTIDTILLPAGDFAYDDSVDSYYSDYFMVYVDSMLPTISSRITLQGSTSGNTVIARMSNMADNNYFRLLAVESGHSLTIKSVKLENGKASHGSAIYGNYASVTIDDSVIDSNYAVNAGGGIFLYGGDLSITDSTVSNNGAGGLGGGISGYTADTAYGTSLSISRSDILDNTAAVFEGAGIYISSGVLEVSDTTVQGNDAVSGAAIYSFYSTVTLDSVTLQSNMASASCGAMQIEYSTVYLLDSMVAQNVASSNGGGICLRESELTVIESGITNNSSTAGNGGGICMSESELSVIESRITDNSSTAGAGGGIYSAYTIPCLPRTIDSSSKIYVDRSTVSGNLAMNGAGAYIAAGDLTIDKSTFSGNNATVMAGAVYHAGANLIVKNSTVSGNVAPMMSAFGIRANTAKIYSSTVYGNSDTFDLDSRAVTFDTVTLPVVHNTIIAGNSGSNCGGDYAGEISTENHNWFDDVSCSGVAQGSPLLGPLRNNNAGLSNATLTHLPMATSGVLDAGDPAFCTEALLGPFDQRGALRNKDICDIGAVEKADAVCFVVKAANGNVITFCL